MIAHVARSGEDRGRVVLQLGSVNPSAAALEAVLRSLEDVPSLPVIGD
jgi:hypothetical protein